MTKPIAFFLLLLNIASSCKKKEYVNINRADSVPTIFYFNAEVESQETNKNLAWFVLNSNIVQRPHDNSEKYFVYFSWNSYLFGRSSHYDPGYYTPMEGGEFVIRAYDSALLYSTLGQSTATDAFGDSLKITFSLNLDATPYQNRDAFDFRINSVKDTTIGPSRPYSSNFYKIFHISIPELMLQNRFDSTDTKTISNIDMRIPVSYR